MFKRFYPMEYCDSIYAINYAALKSQGINGLIFDIDNTIAPFDIPEPDDGTVEFLSKLTGDGFKICLLSNNNEARVVLFNKRLGLHAVHRAAKPGLKGIGKALTLMQVSSDKTALIGDQVFTDVWCGNRKGLYTILVKPIANRDEFSVRLKRGLEKIVVDSYVKKQTGRK